MSALTHPVSVVRARSAAFMYLAFSAGVTRKSIRAVAGSLVGGLPRRLGLSMVDILHTQKRLDKPLQSDILCVRLITAPEPKMNATVQTYRLQASNGRHIRIATKVVFADGFVVRFIERMPKGAAIRQAEEVRAKAVA